MWDHEEIAESLGEGLAAREQELLAEQAVHGLDALDEVELHPILASGAIRGGYAAFRETPYPTESESIPKASERERCDLVLGPGGATGIADAVRVRKERRQAEGTLFAPLAAQLAAPVAGLVDPLDALWLEVKTVGQFSYVDGFAGPNRTYSSQFTSCLADVRKLSRTATIRHAGLGLMLFAASANVAEHDLAAFAHRCLDQELPLAGLTMRRIPIADRIGNGVCVLGLLSLRPGSGP